MLCIGTVVAMAPAPALAHDAFGDLGPFYASLLHPAADPIQAALIVGTAAFLAGRSLAAVRVALPVFIFSAAVGHILLGWLLGLAASAFLSAAVALAAGTAAALPKHWMPLWAGLLLVTASGTLVGLAPDRPQPGAGAFQPILGSLLGIVVFTTFGWMALEASARRISWVAPAVAGSWVAAIGILIAAFSL
jgi:hypothetical protein